MACLPESHDERIHVVLRDRERLSGATGGRTQRLDRHVIQGMLFSDELVGHSGCVNRLAWDNDDGTILASVSDDLKIHLWPFRFDGLDPPAEAGQPYCVETLHTQNIFGVGFLPRSDASLLVTGSMDGSVQLHRLERGAVHYTPRDRRRVGLRASEDGIGSPTLGGVPFSAPQQVGTHTQTFACHIDRVKDIEVSAHEPSLFWSCSEDGTVRQYDIRLPNSQQNNIRSANVLLHSPNLKAERSQRWNPHKGSYFGRYFKYQGINSIRTNPVRPELIAVASQSPHVHVFDRRMCSLRSIQSDVTVSLSTGYAVAGHAEPIMQLKYPPRELLWQSSRPPELERDIRPSYVAWGSNGDKLLANYSSGPAVTWSTCLELCYNDQLSVNLVQEERLVTARLTGGSMYEVDEPGLVDSYWDTYKRTVPFDVERSMSDLARVQTGEGILGTSRAGEDSLRSAKKLIAGLTLEELREVDANDVLRDIAQMFSVFVKERPDDLDLDKEFLWLLFGEYSLRVGPTLGANLLHSVAYPLASLNFEIAASFISQMVARQVWPLRFRGDPGCPDGEWMMGIDAMQEAETLLSLSRKLWVNRNFHSKRKERTIGARYERLFDEILEALFEEQELRPGTFDRGYWTGDDCREAFGFVLGHVEAGYIEAWVTYFARIGNGSVAESMLNTPIMLLGAQSRSFEQMYCYHSNENTDIKEAVFFGTDDSFVLCASDSGAVVAYDAMAEPVSYMESDSTIANCVRPHPYLPIIACSGIDDTVKIFSPFSGTADRVITDEGLLCEFWKNDSERQRIADFGGLSLSVDIGGEGFNVAQLIGMIMHEYQGESLSDEDGEEEDDDTDESDFDDNH